MQLAIIGISDHHTRITCGGSALPQSSPTIGLLFGQQSSSGSGSISISIIDAEEVGIYQEESLMLNPTTREQMQHVQTKIELHQKVFPMHQVVGWYRVVDNNNNVQKDVENDKDGTAALEDHLMDVLPTEKDLEIHNGWMKQFNENPIFVLMDATERNPKHDDEGFDQITTDGEKARRKLDWDEQLPFTIYECIMGGSGAATVNNNDASQSDMVHQNAPVFVNLDFELETFEPERIAVERVLENKTIVPQRNIPDDRNNEKGGTEVVSRQHSGLGDHDLLPNSTVLHLESILTSIDAINARISILLDFLYKTRDGIIEPDYALLRQVMSLVRQLPLVLGRHPLYQALTSHEVSGKDGVGGGSITEEFDKEYNDTIVMSYLATLAQMAKTIVGYSEKMHIVSETQVVGTKSSSEASTKYQYTRR
jgi:hypothetical protein